MTIKFLEIAKQAQLKESDANFLSPREKMFAEMVIYQCISTIRSQKVSSWDEAVESVKTLFGTI